MDLVDHNSSKLYPTAAITTLKKQKQKKKNDKVKRSRRNHYLAASRDLWLLSLEWHDGGRLDDYDYDSVLAVVADEIY